MYKQISLYAVDGMTEERIRIVLLKRLFISILKHFSLILSDLAQFYNTGVTCRCLHRDRLSIHTFGSHNCTISAHRNMYLAIGDHWSSPSSREIGSRST